MTSSLQYLLSLSPLEALVRMVNDENGTNYLLDGFTASAPVALGETTTQVTLTGKPKGSAFDYTAVGGTFTVTYDRLDLAVFLADKVTGYNPTLPLSTQDVLNEITSLIGQKFYIDDIVLEEVTRDNGAAYQLTAKPESLRFVGSIVLPLLTLTAISTLIASTSLSSLPDDESAVLFPLSASVPFLNATDFREIASGFAVGDLAQDKANFVTLFNNVVPDPTSNYDFSLAPWYSSATPGPFNLYNSSIVGYDGGSGVNPAIPGLETAVIINLDGAHCTNFQGGQIKIPYTTQNFENDGYTAKPRLINNDTVSLSNGSAWSVYLNTFTVGQEILSFQVSPPVTMDGSAAWQAIQGLPGPTNLAGSTVVYNGQVRANDLPAATQGLDRILVVTLGGDNSVWQGEYPFYYASPIELTWLGFPILKGTVGSFFSQDFTPSSDANGSSTFTYVTTGDLPDGLSLTGSVLSGTLTTEGSWNFDLTITDGAGTAVVFNLNMLVSTAIGSLSLTGTLPNGVVGVTYSSFLNITGGLLPYSGLGVLGGQLPDGLSMVLEYNTIAITGTPTRADTYPLAITVSSADGQQTSESFLMTVGTSYQPLTLTGNYAPGIVGVNYNSQLNIAGGSGIYSQPAVTAGSLPPGLSLLIQSVGAPQLALQGTPSTTGTYTFTVSVYSSDNQRVESPQTVIIIAASP